jgi:hypothetical protein
MGQKTQETGKPKIVTIARRKHESFVDFCYMSSDEVLAKFLTLPNAKVVQDKDKRRFLYVPPTREDSVLLVAHCDTVFGSGKVRIAYDNGVYRSANENIGIGADDRAGITMLWKLRKLGHAILIPDGEESGCIGSKYLMEHEEWRKIVNTHRFAIEMDRMNKNDLVFYGVGTWDFRKWCEQQFTGYSFSPGSWTDICVLCDVDRHKEDALPGLNISVGYYGQHGSSERLVESEWQRTLSKLHSVLKQEKLPSFRQKYFPKPLYNPGMHNDHSGHNEYHRTQQRRMLPLDRHSGGATEPCGMTKVDTYSMKGDRNTSSAVSVQDSIIVCPLCESVMDEGEYCLNQKKCIYCSKEF